VKDTPAPVPETGSHAVARDAGTRDGAVADALAVPRADAAIDAEADSMIQPIRQYRGQAQEDVTGFPSIMSEVAVDLDRLEFAYHTADMSLYTIFADGTYVKGVDLGGYCIISTLKNADPCKRLLKDENMTVSFFIFPEVVKRCTGGGTGLMDILEQAFQDGKPLEFTYNELWASYIRTAAGDFLSDKSVFTYNDPNLVYTFIYGSIGQGKDAVHKLRAKVDKAWAGKDCERVEY
jgi:hypothetical protein